MISIESTAKSVQKAIEEGLERLGKTIDEVDIKIISSGGLFKKARVEIIVLESEKPARDNKNRDSVRDIQAEQATNAGRHDSDRNTERHVAEHSDKVRADKDNRDHRFDKGSERNIQDIRSGGRDGDNRENRRDGGANAGQRVNAEQRREQPKGQSDGHRAQKDTQREIPREQTAHEQGHKDAGKDNRPKTAEEKLVSDNSANEKHSSERNKPNERPFSHNKPQNANKGQSAQDRVRPNVKPQLDKSQFEQEMTIGEKDNHERPRTTREEERHERPRTEVTEEISRDAVTFVEGLLSKMAMDFALKTEVKNGELTIDIECGSGSIIGYRGETLDAIEYITSLAINKSDDKYYRINVDCNDYRSKRVETLAALARRMAEKAVKTGRKVVLEPMSSSSRKIIHSILSENDRIITKSEGKEPARRIVIIPKRFR